jgi:hypothetical protein
MNSLYSTPWGGGGGNQHGLNLGPFYFRFLRPRDCPTNYLKTLLLFFMVTGKTTGLISRNNFVKKNFVCISHHDNDLARCDSIFPMLRCQGVWNKISIQLSLSQILFQNPKNYSLGDVQRFCYHSWCNFWHPFLTKSATAAMFTSVQVNFGRPPLSSSSTNSLPPQNWEYNLETFIGSEPHSLKTFALILVFLSQTDQLWNKIIWQLSVHFHHPWHIKKTDFTRQVITRTLSKINKRNWVCKQMLVDST